MDQPKVWANRSRFSDNRSVIVMNRSRIVTNRSYMVFTLATGGNFS
ncbi:hypothetical protein [Bacillus sp. REN10]|nr:hypothetical protein [Bacillus sp. REN10]